MGSNVRQHFIEAQVQALNLFEWNIPLSAKSVKPLGRESDVIGTGLNGDAVAFKGHGSIQSAIQTLPSLRPEWS